MNHPSPAIVSQTAVRRLPRLALLLLCAAYLLPGLFNRMPWKSADMSAFGYMAELAHGNTAWLEPRLMGLLPEVDALLPYWLGAWAMQLAPSWLSPDVAARVPFAILLCLTLSAAWYAIYYLARGPEAQPVAFAFGGEALVPDYARAMADGGLLALIASLGLAQLSHESTPAAAQLCFTAQLFFGTAALPYRAKSGFIGCAIGLFGLTLSGAPVMSLLFGLGSAAIYGAHHEPDSTQRRLRLRLASQLAGLTLAAALLATQLSLWHWRIELPEATWSEWRSLGRLLLWFTWPTWPLALWTLWRWRFQLLQKGSPGRHLALPLWYAAIALVATFTTGNSDRSLILALPALAALAAFALPTLSRTVTAVIDWFTLVFFSGCAIIVWVVWLALETGVPAQPAANVARLAPGFVHSFSFALFFIALTATLAWAWLVKWRAGRHRAAIWKSLVLPAGGATLCWLLAMTLWMPMLDYARSYTPMIQRATRLMPGGGCAESYGLNRGQIAAFEYHAGMRIEPVGSAARCPWLMVATDTLSAMTSSVDMKPWLLQGQATHPVDHDESVQIYKRQPASPP